ncbi:MAG: hypothetical protein EOM14_02345 [Clostridia bacterium]|nr:hypothetical protein [Clostridia bacterium]
MKKYIGFLLALLLALSLYGCGNSNAETPNSPTGNQEIKPADNTGTSSENTEVNSLDGLSGQELYEAAMAVLASNEVGKCYQIEMVSTDYTGQQVTSITTVWGENYKVKTETAEGVSVYIYNDEEGASYSYDETTGQGYRMKESEDNYQGGFGGELSEDDDFGSVKTAELGEFLYREVLIVVFDSSDDYGAYETEVWYDLELETPLKTIMSENGTVVQEMTATMIDAEFEADKLAFVPPSDIQITDISY